METLTFAVKHDYGPSGAGIEIPVTLSIGDRHSVRLVAKLDTGAESCIFQRDYAEQLGLTVESGVHRRFYTVAGYFDAYGHEVTLTCFEWEFAATVYFAASEDHRRNVLGRMGWLTQFRLGLIEHDSTLLLSHYDD